MDLIKKLQARRKAVKSVVVETKTLGEVELLAPFASHRFDLIRSSSKEGTKNFALTLICMCMAEDGVRLIDSMDLEEVIDIFDVLGADDDGLADIDLLFSKANELSKTLNTDVEEAEKN